MVRPDQPAGVVPEVQLAAGVHDEGDRRRRVAVEGVVMNRAALEELVAELGDLNAAARAVVQLARDVADQLDGGQTANAALVKQYRDLLGGLADVKSEDPAKSVLSVIRDAASA